MGFLQYGSHDHILWYLFCLILAYLGLHFNNFLGITICWPHVLFIYMGPLGPLGPIGPACQRRALEEPCHELEEHAASLARKRAAGK